MKTILAIDPGSEESAWVQYHQSGMILGKGKCLNMDLLSLIPLYRFDVLVCEMVACYGMAVGKEVFETARWVGRYEQKADDLQREFSVVYRKEVKIHLCNSMKAKDGNIRQALIDKFGKPGTKKNQGATFGIVADIWQALGVAVTYSESIPTKHAAAKEI